jgi:hypothetical protein
MRYEFREPEIYNNPPMYLIPREMYTFDSAYAYAYVKFFDEVGDEWLYAIGRVVTNKLLGKEYNTMDVQDPDGETRKVVLDHYTPYKHKAYCLKNPLEEHVMMTHPAKDMIKPPYILSKPVAEAISKKLSEELKFFRNNGETKNRRMMMMHVNKQLAGEDK